MTQSAELQTITGILERTPQVQPFYSEVRDAIMHLNDGDGSDFPVFELLHGHISALASAGKLSGDWEIIQVNGGRVIAHRDFLKIQDEFIDLEKGEASKLRWDSAQCKDAFRVYIEKMKEYRQRHISLFQQCLNQLDEETRSAVLSIANDRFTQLASVPEDISIVALPSWLDNPKLWTSMGITSSLTDRIPPWAKIHGLGVVFASRKHRDDKPYGYDYFSYAARCVVNGEVDKIGKKLSLTAQHEGSHGIVDAILIYLLGIDAYNPIGEGIPGSLGDDGRGLKHTDITFKQLLENPCPEDNRSRSESAYIAGPKFWDSVVLLLQNRGLTKDQAWVEIFSSSLKSAIEMTAEKNFKSQNKGKKVARLIEKIIGKLEITFEELESVYESLNQESL